ncbi:hypothetical protein AGDE_14306 [Angomonas deanei]|uniref:Uncharacterized protein n=1 Tax=Angomonas deanei TaxID=59799 RepID=A0A7G2CJV6_9TRYP|nr:hypothetical protein AGDE_14306 [Angomonas deanei]CAD2219655.1 hypothetical protein, conserved [Angomonas deanei]|eukprot:EPY21071.1 hypothetical protein AGDE_14306 [Angomonas deanei]
MLHNIDGSIDEYMAACAEHTPSDDEEEWEAHITRSTSSSTEAKVPAKEEFDHQVESIVQITQAVVRHSSEFGRAAPSLLYEALCVVRGASSTVFHQVTDPTGNSRWLWKKEVLDHHRTTSTRYMYDINQMVRVANRMEVVRKVLRCFSQFNSHFDDLREMVGPLRDYAYFESFYGTSSIKPVDATVALVYTAFSSVRRLFAMLQEVYTQFILWTERSFKPSMELDEEAAFVKSVAVDNPFLTCIERILAVIEGCGLEEAITLPPTESEGYSLNDVRDRCGKGASLLLDFLIIQCSAYQSSATIELYRFYLMVLLHCTWPYVCLCTSVVFGVVVKVDPASWRLLLPRLFRSSFSHIKVNQSHQRQYPTDLLSLMLNCIDYEEEGESTGIVNESSLRSLRSARLFIVKRLQQFSTRKLAKLFRKRARPPSVESSSAKAANDLDSILYQLLEDGHDAPRSTTSGDGEVALKFSSSLPLHISLDKQESRNLLLKLSVHKETSCSDVSLGAMSMDRDDRRSIASAELWLNVNIPVARWITAALLLPIGTVIQRLQKHRLQELLHYKVNPLNREELLLYKSQHFNLMQSLRLLVDICLCRDRERTVEQFVKRLLEYHYWWHRTAVVNDEGTASGLVSSLFTDALKGKAFGHLVKLTVLPPQDGESEREDVLNTFSAFKLSFMFPQSLRLVLLPVEVSVVASDSSDELHVNHFHLFWRRRRGVDACLASASVDVWSSFFGYLCSLHYLQEKLSKQRAQVKEQTEFNRYVMKELGVKEDSDMVHHITHSHQAAYRSLSFVLNSLLSFTLLSVEKFVYDLEHLLKQVGSANSCVELAMNMDRLLVSFSVVCFHASSKAVTQVEKLNAFAVVRDAVVKVMRLTLELESVPANMVLSRTGNTVESLVVKLSCVRQPFPRTQLDPLLNVLTFNRYYGADQNISFQFR